jgi:uncharacterized protein
LLSERWAEDASLVQALREWLWNEGLFKSKLADGKDENNADVSKFRDYFDYDEPIGRVPSHRALAVFRGRAMEMLDAKLVLPVEPEPGKPSIAEGKIAMHLGWSHAARPSDDLIRKCVAWTWRVKLSLSTERDLFTRLREDAALKATPVIMLTAESGSAIISAVARLGARDYIVKPFEERALLAKIGKVLPLVSRPSLEVAAADIRA